MRRPDWPDGEFGVVEPGHVLAPSRLAYQGIGGRPYWFDKDWLAQEQQRSRDFFAAYRRRSDACIILGNGPSLSRVDPQALSGFDYLVSNNILLDPDIARGARLYAVTNHLVASQLADRIRALDGPTKLYPYWLAPLLPAADGFLLNAVTDFRFFTDPSIAVSWVSTVSYFLMQVAHGLGYRTVGLLGFDHRYQQPRSSAEGEVLKTMSSDPNHFHDQYFVGMEWQAADVTRMAAAYRLADQGFRSAGGMILNLTDGGDLHVFRRMSLADFRRLAG